MSRPLLLGPDPASPFPPAELALDEPDGLVCIGGDLSPVRLVNAYAAGMFPWFSEGQPILWWSPSERLVFRSEGVRLSRRPDRKPAPALHGWGGLAPGAVPLELPRPHRLAGALPRLGRHAPPRKPLGGLNPAPPA